MPIYKLRECQNGRQLGETIEIEVENLQVAKKKTLLRSSIFADELHIENEVGDVLLKRINGVWKDPSFCPLPKPGRKPIKKASSDPVFVIRELHNNVQIQMVTIQSITLYGAKLKASRLADRTNPVLTIENEAGVVLLKRINGVWKYPSFCPLPKPGRKPIKKASSDPVFVIRELRNNRQIQTVTIHAQNLRGAKHQAFRLAEQMDSVLTIETIDGVLLTRRENEGWQVPVDY
jgi:hypothetical protein